MCDEIFDRVLSAEKRREEGEGTVDGNYSIVYNTAKGW
jgi:hypothetical protein